MHKKLEAELVSLAHKILQMKNKDEAAALRDKAREVYEKLTVLAYVDEYVETTPNLSVSKDEILKKIDKTLKIKSDKIEKQKIAIQREAKQEQTEATESVKKEDTVFEPKFESVKIDLQTLKSNQISSKEEFRDAISADKTATLFEDAEATESGKKTLNDKLVNKTITVGLNDRIAFVNNLFNYNQTAFNKVLSQLNTFKTEREAKDFLLNTVKPDYDWSTKEEYEERFLALIERKFT
ncbi:MAG: hypothetical protein QNJ57_02500 [Flavobacteriaceae bacterium]|nr:hypothetical protein [Flavobacteriaceae bacterium]